MPTLRFRTTLTLEERAERQRLVVRDALALTTLLTIVLALIFTTYLLFHSFAAHRTRLEQRWHARGELALRNGRPQVAIESLRSALAYAPDDRGLQVELATALAEAGRTQEALVYFNTLHESAPGDGMINLQLARLAIRQGNVPAAVDDYEAALDGTWNGDGTLRRREVRLELARYLIAQHRFDEARSQLLIAAGNAADNHQLQLTAAALLEQAQGDGDALHLYRKAMAFRDTRTAAMVGAGRTAAAESHYLAARNLLQEAIQQPDYAHLPEDERNAVHGLIEQANQLLVLFPSPGLTAHARAVRVAHDAQVASARLASCAAPVAPAAATPSNAPSAPVSAQPVPPQSPLRSALSAVARARDSLAGPATSAPPTLLPGVAEAGGAASSTLSGLGARWQALPPETALGRKLERDPALLQTTLLLVYDTERTTAQLCGAPAGEDALLLKIAEAPDEIEQP